MIIFLHGEDSYRLNADFSKIVESYKTKYSPNFDLNLFNFRDKEEGMMARLENSIKAMSFLNDKKLVAVKNLLEDKNTSEILLSLIKDYDLKTSQDTILIVSENLNGSEIQKKNKDLYKILSDSKNTVRAYESLKGAQLSKWISLQFKDKGLNVNPSAVEILVDFVGNDSHALANEINKLSNYCFNSKTVDRKDVVRLVSSKIDPNIFELTDALSAKNKPKAFELLYIEQKNGRDPFYILSMITTQFRNLLMVKDLASSGLKEAEIIKKSGLHPFVIKKSKHAAENYTKDELVLAYQRLLAVDIGTKTGIKDIDLELSRFIFSF